eukprot:SM000025S08461  [mRNA]  locus=s25:903346:904561:+ [translate_table: standard]
MGQANFEPTDISLPLSIAGFKGAQRLAGDRSFTAPLKTVRAPPHLAAAGKAAARSSSSSDSSSNSRGDESRAPLGAGSGRRRARRGRWAGSRAAMNVGEEVARLADEIRRLGSPRPDGSTVVKFGVLFRDDVVANTFEALVGTLRAAKKRRVVAFDGEMLFQGVHDDVDIVLLPVKAAEAPSPPP